MLLTAIVVARSAAIASAAVAGMASAQLGMNRWAAVRFARRVRSARRARLVSEEPTRSPAPPAVRFGLVHLGRRFRRWEIECLDQLAGTPSVGLSAVVVPVRDPEPPLPRPTWPSRLLACMARRGPWAPADASKYLSGVPKLRCHVSSTPTGYAFTADDLAALRDQRLDFLITFDPERWTGGVLEITRWGLWAVRYPGQLASGDAPPGFWEICREETTTAAVLVALSDDPAGDRVLKQGVMRTPGESYSANAAEVLSEVACWPAQVCRQLDASRDSMADAPRLRSHEPDPPPRARDLFQLVLSMTHDRWREFARKNLHADVWNIGVVHAPIASFLDPNFRPAVQWCPAMRRGQFRADPFGLIRDGRLTILCEHFEYSVDRGWIVALDPAAQAGQAQHEIAIAPPFHVSYPYLLEHDGQVLCVPETHEAREIGLYRADEFPTRWTKLATLMDGVPALDATIFRHGDHWWLACTMQGPTERSHLYLYHAPDLLGPWTPHIGNPVKTDIRSARPGGTPFLHQGVLYRPAQDSSRTYGGRVVINRVTALTPDRFEEEPVAVVGPLSGSPYPDGVHTLSAAGPVTILDAKRVVLFPNALGLAGMGPYLRRRMRYVLGMKKEPA